MRTACSVGVANAGVAACAARRFSAQAAATAEVRRASRELPFPTLCLIIATTHSQLSFRLSLTIRPESPTPDCLSRPTSPSDDMFLVRPVARLITRQTGSRVTAHPKSKDYLVARSPVHQRCGRRQGPASACRDALSTTIKTWRTG